MDLYLKFGKCLGGFFLFVVVKNCYLWYDDSWV